MPFCYTRTLAQGKSSRCSVLLEAFLRLSKLGSAVGLRQMRLENVLMPPVQNACREWPSIVDALTVHRLTLMYHILNQANICLSKA